MLYKSQNKITWSIKAFQAFGSNPEDNFPAVLARVQRKLLCLQKHYC